LVITYIK